MANENLILVPGRLHSVATEGHVSGSDEIFDDSLNKDQQTINAEVAEAIGTGGSVDSRISAAINALDSSKSQSAGADGLALNIVEENGKITSISGSIASNTYDAYGTAATEATRAQNAESALGGRVTTLETAVGSGGSVDSRIAAAKAEIKGSATSACDTLGEAEALISAEASRAQAAEQSITTTVTSRLDTQDAEIALLNGAEVIVVEDHTAVSSPDSQKIYREIGTSSYTDWMNQTGNANDWKAIAIYTPGIEDVPTAGSNNLVKSGGVYKVSETSFIYDKITLSDFEYVSNTRRKFSFTTQENYKYYLKCVNSDVRMFVALDDISEHTTIWTSGWVSELSINGCEAVLCNVTLKKSDERNITAPECKVIIENELAERNSEDIFVLNTSVSGNKIINFKRLSPSRLYFDFTINNSGIINIRRKPGFRMLLQNADEETIIPWSLDDFSIFLSKGNYRILVAKPDDAPISPEETFVILQSYIPEVIGTGDLCIREFPRLSMQRLSKPLTVNAKNEINIKSDDEHLFILQTADDTNLNTWSNDYTFSLERGDYNLIVKRTDDGIIDQLEATVTISQSLDNISDSVENAVETAQAALSATVEHLGNYNVIVAAYDTDVSLKPYAGYICPQNDAREVLQNAINESATKKVKCVLLPGTYVINSRSDISEHGSLYLPNVEPSVDGSYIWQKGCCVEIEGAIKPISFNGGVVIKMGDDLYNSIGANEEFSFLYNVYYNIYQRFASIKNIIFLLPNNQKPITMVDGRYATRVHFENINVSAVNVRDYTFEDMSGTLHLPQVPNPGCVGIRMVGSANYGASFIENCLALGFGVGFDISGEHITCDGLGAFYCSYGYRFGGYRPKSSINTQTDLGTKLHYPITCLKLCDEHNINMPLFDNGADGGNILEYENPSIEIYGMNIQFPTTCPGHEDRTSSDFLTGRNKAKETQAGSWKGIINYILDNAENGAVHLCYDKFFADGDGLNFKCTNMLCKFRGPTIERNKYNPNVEQTFFDTTLNKMLIFNGTNWTDFNGNVV